jgi:anti-sigma regulatory factor (Ser/Thr protein kinase)
MEIIVPSRFVHAGELDPIVASLDPRRAALDDGTLDIDMRGCDFIQPPAVLWCVVYQLLAAARGANCRLLVPENLGVCIYLKSVRLFGILQDQGVEVDDRGIDDRQTSQLILPLTKFLKESDVDRLANEALDHLRKSSMGAANLYPVVSEVFAELALNAVQHAESSIGAFGLIQFYESGAGSRFVCTVADGGIGIRRSLERNPQLRSKVPYDWTAIELALEEGVSGTGSNRRGIGLFGVAEDMRKPDRQLIIHSGIGMLQIAGNSSKMTASRIRVLFPGTLVSASIPT